jgi:hypothetical protein
MGVELTELVVGDEADAWERAGFAVDDGATWIGGVRIRLAGGSGGRGVRSAGVDVPELTSIDGLDAHHTARLAAPADLLHPNGVTGFDHVVVTSPDLDRTVGSLAAVGLELRRVREVGTPERPRRQMFFWFGEPILELVGPAEPRGDGPSRIFGLACTVGDLDATAAHLGDACGRVKDAVQPGRRIATLRHEPLGMSVPVAFMSAHVRESRPG